MEVRSVGKLSNEELVQKYKNTEGLEKQKVFNLILKNWDHKIKKHVYDEISKFHFIRHIEEDDLYQTAVHALIESIKKFDSNECIQFSTYAWTAINNSINRIIQSYQTGKRASEMEGIVCIDDVKEILKDDNDFEKTFFARNVISEIKRFIQKEPCNIIGISDEVLNDIKKVVKNSFPVCQTSRDVLNAVLVVMLKEKRPLPLRDILLLVEKMQCSPIDKKISNFFWQYITNHKKLLRRCKDRRYKCCWFITKKGIKTARKLGRVLSFHSISKKYNMDMSAIEKIAPTIKESLNKEMYMKMIAVLENGCEVRKELTRTYGMEVEEAMDKMSEKAMEIANDIGLSKEEILS